MLHALSPLDGRYRKKVNILAAYFSEFALMQYRLRVEIEYLAFLSKETKIVRPFTKKEQSFLRSLWKSFDEAAAARIQEIEKRTKHDVKAAEYYLQEKLEKTSLRDIVSFVHFALTSYDTNTIAYALMLLESRRDAVVPLLHRLLTLLRSLMSECKSMTMLSRTHGQPAVPTTMGKELAVFYNRLRKEQDIVISLHIEAKLTGAVGNYNAHAFVYPRIDWMKFSRKFIVSFGLTPNVITTQILPYDNWIRLFDSVRRMNNILVDLSQDIWWYISMEYFHLKKAKGQVGSSTMAHKVNPIQFENAEGNLQIANSLFELFARKLPISRLQRDLSDSTVTRNFGVAFGHTLLAWESLISGLQSLQPNRKKMQQDLNGHWEIFAEGILTYLRAKGFTDAYELLREKTQGKTMKREEVMKVIDELPIGKKEKSHLKISSLDRYCGIASQIVGVVDRT